MRLWALASGFYGGTAIQRPCSWETPARSALGGLIGYIAIVIRQELTLVLVGGIFVIEAMSVMIQVGWFKYTRKRTGTGRRVFLMAPLHPPFSEKGMDRKPGGRAFLAGGRDVGGDGTGDGEAALSDSVRFQIMNLIDPAHSLHQPHHRRLPIHGSAAAWSASPNPHSGRALIAAPHRPFADYFHHLLDRRTAPGAFATTSRTARGFASTRKEAENVKLSREVISLIPPLLKHPHVLGIGEIGFE